MYHGKCLAKAKKAREKPHKENIIERQAYPPIQVWEPYIVHTWYIFMYVKRGTTEKKNLIKPLSSCGNV